MIAAVFSKNIYMVNALLQASADVNVTKPDGTTAFMSACQEGYLDVAKRLSCGSDALVLPARASTFISTKKVNGEMVKKQETMTAHELAVRYQNWQIVDWLEESREWTIAEHRARYAGKLHRTVMLTDYKTLDDVGFRRRMMSLNKECVDWQFASDERDVEAKKEAKKNKKKRRAATKEGSAAREGAGEEAGAATKEVPSARDGAGEEAGVEATAGAQADDAEIEELSLSLSKAATEQAVANACARTCVRHQSSGDYFGLHIVFSC